MKPRNQTRDLVAELRRKKLFLMNDGKKAYFVWVVCPRCGNRRELAFAGWTAIMCGGRGCEGTTLWKSKKTLEKYGNDRK